MRAFGAAPLHIAVAIRLVGDPSDAPVAALNPSLAMPAATICWSTWPRELRVEVPGFGHHLLGDRFTQLPAGELAVGVGQVEPPGPRGR